MRLTQPILTIGKQEHASVIEKHQNPTVKKEYTMGDNNCIRFSLIVVNVIFLLVGLAILGLGIWVQVEKGDYVALAESDTGLTGAILLIIIGSVTAVISLIGFIGAGKKIACLLWLFFSVLCVILAVEIIALIFGFVYRDKIEDELHEDMNKTIAEYDTNGNDGVTKAWDWAQQKFECCGVDNYKSWIKSITKFNVDGNPRLVPDSCCKDETKGCGDFRIPITRQLDLNKIYQRGCFTELKEFIKDHLLTIGLSSLVFVIVELVIIILTLLLVTRLSRDSTVV